MKVADIDTIVVLYNEAIKMPASKLVDGRSLHDGALSAAELLPLVYDELRRLAATRIAAEAPGHTLQATALVHEAYLRLVGPDDCKQWHNRGHFFAAAAEAMRRILVESARRKNTSKHGGGWIRLPIDEVVLGTELTPAAMVEFDEVLTRLHVVDPMASRLVELRYFAGLTMLEAAETLGSPLRTVERNWTFARTWLHRELTSTPRPPTE